MIEDLKRKSHAAAMGFDEKAVCAPEFLDRYVDSAGTGVPLMKFLSGAMKASF